MLGDSFDIAIKFFGDLIQSNVLTIGNKKQNLYPSVISNAFYMTLYLFCCF